MLRWEKPGERSLWVVRADGGGEELQGKTGREEQSPSGDGENEEQGKKLSSKRHIFSFVSQQCNHSISDSN